MTSPFEPSQKIPIKLPSNHPDLLLGLDDLLELGLISDDQVKQLARQYLVCTVVFTPQTESEPEVISRPPTASQRPLIATLPPILTVPKKPSFVNSMLQSWGEELSVRWLLFLGVFLVVLSSGVLAASQWERFPAVGQYGVLFAYTLSFCGFTLWAGKQSNLRLTAQTLLIVTLLLVPINFWAMDSFSLWQNPLNLVVMGIASLTLTFITNQLCQNRNIINNFPSGKLPLINIIGLSYLHWGWKLSVFPLIAVYLAMIGTTTITVYNQLTQSEESTNTETSQWGISLYFTFLIYALLTLLTRAIFIAGVNITQLGLAIGICGSLVIWLSEKNLSTNSSELWEKLGGSLLLLGWLVSVITQPNQAIILSGLSLWIFSIRLQRYRLKVDFLAIFLIGLQTIWLGWRLVPNELQRLVISTTTHLTNSQNEPWALLSIALFAYIILMLWITNKLYHQENQEIANFGEYLTLFLGICLTIISLVNPTLRTINFLLSTITLATFIQRCTAFSPSLIYLTHGMGILTLISSINWFLPSLNKEIWAGILLAIMIAEWGFSLGNGIWRRSAWYIGLVLAALSFSLLWVNLESYWYGNLQNRTSWGIIWLITPLTLTALAIRNTEPNRTTNSFLTVLAVGVSQLLTLPLPGIRLIGLGVGVGVNVAVMLVNTRYLRNQIYAGTIIGFGLSFLTALLWEGVFGLIKLTISGWFVVTALTILSLWLWRGVLLRKVTELAIIYAVASDKWAIALCTIELSALTLHSSLIYQGIIKTEYFYVITTAIILGAILYRSWGQSKEAAFYGIGWCLELLTAEILGFGEHSVMRIAIGNIILGLTTQLFGEWWRRKHQLQTLPNSFNILPLIYGAFSVIFRLNTFADFTGFCSLGVALILIGVGRRREAFKLLLYFGIIGLSISAYELLFYQMSLSRGGVLGDGLIAMSALGTSIMYAYRILTPWLISYLCLTPRELKNIAHIHWAWSSILFLSAITLSIQINFSIVLGTGLFLVRYAIWQGRENSQETNQEVWVYLGLIEAGIIGIYLQSLPIGRTISEQLLPWNGAISCLFAYFLYILPWGRLGWSKIPWQRTAYVLPLIILGTTGLKTYPITLIIVAAYYIFLAKAATQIRFTYISLILIDWALFTWFNDLNLRDSLSYVIPIGLSLLYIAEVDEQLKLSTIKPLRQSLRMLGSGLICGWTILFYQNLPFIPGVFSMITIFAGLGLKVRAFLYVGTGTFLITSIYQLVIFSLSYSFLKWIVGLLVGILLIYIAANFETRRTQITAILRNISDEFANWD
ncbi:MAG: hypothetical protein AN481_17125 [Aphanizomenon flos-aquae LD13]|jgi:hypothetical protein|uniref:DUF2157 domain-containing protein n=1 Tax=Aphanizomenon flos-aquae LD13 TaxID=1710894 RepID=A0A1B7VLD5_APHFL|nr:DUF2157 domain-containing protein [Aphanizomenon flos-aquae UKL13-PB]MBO1059777.1 DUF2157 domain-containing protein [Aphanizomenon flos-aquae CP01]OBQ20449.1 MAG: hypothetical protein AN481_17125 [Aphanizomenon flos-aquae LD13]HCQ21775.1 DUF2157 domain-containing protein [Anabaena sp. UBA12330]